ncbi:MAG: peptidylprolyl isomerase [bacterium]
MSAANLRAVALAAVLPLLGVPAHASDTDSTRAGPSVTDSVRVDSTLSGTAVADSAGAPAGKDSTEAAPGEVVDRIVALVGDEIVLLSEVDEELYLESLRGTLDLNDVKAVADHRKDVLDALVEGKVLLEEARRQGIRVDKADVDRALDAQIADVRHRFPTEDAFLAQLAKEGTTIEQLRESQRSKIEEQLMVRQLVTKTVSSKVEVDEREIRAYWDEHHADIPRVPARIDLSRILVGLHSSDVVDSAAVRRAQIVKERLDAGEDFATLAKVFSEGPGADQGGDIGWVRREDLDPVIAAAVQGLAAGQVTGVVMSARGPNLIKVEETDPAKGMRLAQIVFLRDETAAKARAKAKAEAILARLRGGEAFADVATKESEDAATAKDGGHVGLVPIESLQSPYRSALESLPAGQVSDLIEDEQGFSIFRVDAREGERDATYEDVRDRLEEIIRNKKSKALYDQVLAAAREKTYVEIRLDDTRG